jgi:hypothetical protein
MKGNAVEEWSRPRRHFINRHMTWRSSESFFPTCQRMLPAFQTLWRLFVFRDILRSIYLLEEGFYNDTHTRY